MNRSLYSILGTGVPGSVMGMTEALKKYGTLPLEVVMAPAIRLAEQGYTVSFDQEHSFTYGKSLFQKDPSSRNYFLKSSGEAYRAGDKLVQKDLARTLKIIANKGASGFYQGEVADLIVAEMKKKWRVNNT